MQVLCSTRCAFLRVRADYVSTYITGVHVYVSMYVMGQKGGEHEWWSSDDGGLMA